MPGIALVPGASHIKWTELAAADCTVKFNGSPGLSISHKCYQTSRQ